METNKNIKSIHWSKENHPTNTVFLNYFDGMLNEGTCLALEFHIDNCLSCQAKVKEIRILLVEHQGDVSKLKNELDTNAMVLLNTLKENDLFVSDKPAVKRKGRMIPLKRIKFASGIAAGILLFIAVKLFNAEANFESNYVPISFHVSATDANRSIENGENETFNLAVDKYINNEYELAKGLFLKICENKTYLSSEDITSYSRAYLGIIEMELDPSNKASIKNNFEQAYNLGNDSIKTITSFFLGNLSYNEEDFESAKLNFENLQEHNEFYLQLTKKEEAIFSRMLSKLH